MDDFAEVGEVDELVTYCWLGVVLEHVNRWFKGFLTPLRRQCRVGGGWNDVKS
jgi:hypothetical protein